MSELQKKLDAAKALQAAQQSTEKPEETKTQEKPEVEATETSGDLDSLVAAFGVEQKHPQAPIIMGDISEEEKAEALAAAQAAVVKPVGLYAYTAGAIFGKRGLVKLTPTPFGNFQTKEDMEATGTEKSWEHLIKLNQAYVVEE